MALSEIAATGRRFGHATQPEILAIVRDRLAPGRALDAFIGDHIGDDGVRRERSRAIGRDALALTFRRRTIADL